MRRTLIVGLLGLILGCGSDSSPTQPPRHITFSPESSAPANSISLSQLGVSPETLTLDVLVRDVEDVELFNFNILYPQDLLQYDGWEEGDVLNLHVGPTISFPGVFNLFWHSPVMSFSGSGTLLTIKFRRLNEGRGSIVFDPDFRRLGNSSGDEITNLSWVGGEVVVE